MKSKLFGRTNPNDVLFNIETQEGSDILEGDDSVASIGDATLEHVQRMSRLDRMAWDEHIQMPDGNIFRTEDNPRWDDPDEFNLASKDQLERFLEANNLPENLRKVYEEALERKQDEEASEDVMDHPEELIPYEDWERFGGMSKFWDIPPVPKPKLVFCGNSRVPFYDDFPEDHPLTGFIGRVLMTLDRFEWHQIMTDEGIAQYNLDNPRRQLWKPEDGFSHILTDGKDEFLNAEEYIGILEKSIRMERAAPEFKANVLEVLSGMILDIAKGKDGDPVETAQRALRKMEAFHFSFYKRSVIEKTKVWDPLYVHICKIGNNAIKLAKQGKDTYTEIKRFGQELFEKGFTCEKLVSTDEADPSAPPVKATVVERPRLHHWQKYRAIKQEIERIRDLRQATRVTEAVQTCIERIEKAKKEAIKAKNLRLFTGLSTELMQAQKSGEILLSQRERDLVWASYNASKQEVSDYIRAGTKAA